MRARWIFRLAAGFVGLAAAEPTLVAQAAMPPDAARAPLIIQVGNPNPPTTP